MCGIIGYVGEREAAPVLVGGLRRLEYRGYDSAGLAVQAGSSLTIVKRAGRVAALAGAVEGLEHAHCGIAHTRWATHGAPTETNAHPHTGNDGVVAIVHNGIIENYAALKAELLAAGHVFRSQTDTEVLAHLVEKAYAGDLLAAVRSALGKVRGSFGLCAITPGQRGVIVVARRGSPICIGVGEGESFIASDPVALLAHATSVIHLGENEVARVTAHAVDLRTLEDEPVERPAQTLTGTPEEYELNGYEHFMRKEIFEQPESLANTLGGRLDLNAGTALLSGFNFTPRDLASIRRVVFIGCGSSLHSGMVGAYALEEMAGVQSVVMQAADFRYRNPVVGPDDLVVAISQSGETADTLAALHEARERGATVAAIVNRVGSAIAREAGRGCYLYAGHEASVASTKAFTSQTVATLMLALKFARTRRLGRDAGIAFAKELQNIPALVRRVLETEPRIIDVAEKIMGAKNALFIGRGYHFSTALEGALKLKEVSYMHAEGYHAAEMKHGPIALLDESCPVVAIATYGSAREKTLSNIAECHARSAPVVAVLTDGDDEAAAHVDFPLFIPKCEEAVACIPASVVLQLLAYHVARLRNLPIDRPRNLAKSVTVE